MPKPFTLNSPLPEADLRFEAMSFSAGLSTLDEMHLELLSERADLDPAKLLGETVDLAVTLRDGSTRHFHGHVTRFGIGRHRGRQFGYRAVVRPWLWFLTRTSDCRIFQDQTVREIVETVFKDHAAIAQHEFKLVRSYRKRVYCVQYRETDFNFVARLLEDEGICWYFEHQKGVHKLVLTDGPGTHHPPIAGETKLPFYDNEGQVPPDTDYVSQWNFSCAVKAGKTVLTSYDFERPSTSLKVEQEQQRSHAQSDAELFDYQGDYVQKADGQQLADDRLDEQQGAFESASGRSNAHALAAGHRFQLVRHPRADQNAEYVCARLELSASDQSGEAGTGGPGQLQCSFTAIRADQPFRPPRRTPKPFVQGPQTAVVVGPSGEEIFTDKYGRVKVQFHWDRYGGRNEKSSCWLRVSSPWAGKSFGLVQIPRIGQEVVVDFLEGDPDQPLVVGRVYNAEQMPPWELPANATQSGLLTRSSKGGAYGNANAIRFEDKKGSEQLWIHAEKNQDIEVENDETHSVGHDRKKTIENDETTHVRHDRTETVDHDEKITIGNNRTESVGSNETITIGSNRSINVGGSETATVALQRTHAVGVNESIAIGVAQEVAIGAAQLIAVGTNQSTSVGVNQSTDVGSNRSVEVGKDQTHQIGANRSAQVAKDDALKVGKNLVIDAGDSVTIKTGSASVTMKKDGTITIKGKDITIDASGKINVKASSNVVIRGSKVLQN